jgi:enediyne biosynthesis protein E4
MLKKIYYLLGLGILWGASACQKAEKPLFELLSAEKTGIDFSNDLKPTNDLNIFHYMYFYNGGGVGAGDFNNDGLIDLYFTANQKDNKLYLNRGGMKFEEVTKKSFPNMVSGAGFWSNGVSVIDINQDGKLDLYVNVVGGFEGIKGHNLLYICTQITPDGIPIYEEKALQYGLSLEGFGTQAAFFDYDLDGDLDMFQLNHSVHQNGTFGERKQFKGTVSLQAGDRMFSPQLVDGQLKYIEITAKAGIISDVLGYGLGVAVGDVNFDGYPDMYIGNDFHENDYLYINQKNGSFKETLEESMMHTSQFSMGIDIADINNDVFPEIISLDMLPFDREILKRSEGEDSYNIFRHKIRQGYNYQFARNNLQFNNGNGTFSEMGMYAGVYATDWSWSPLLIDFDNNGQKDLFISNGIPKRMNDTDYINFVSTDEIQQKIQQKQFDEADATLIDKLPEIKIPNKFYLNSPGLKFKDLEEQIQNNENSYSNGALYADLDNDGDLDIVSNNINQRAFIYENKANEYAPRNESISLVLKGSEQNRNAIGARVLVFKKDEILSFEKYPVKAFQASMEVPLLIGLGQKASVDSMILIWPDRTFQKIDPKAKNQTIAYQKGLKTFDFEGFKQKRQNQNISFEDLASQVKLDLIHEENDFGEFDREMLIPHKVSTEGPALSVADINHDGLDDVFLGSTKYTLPKVMLQSKNGTFSELKQAIFKKDSLYEEVDAQWIDLNHDTHLDLVVAEGGNEYFGNSPNLYPRLYLNDGKGNLTAKEDAFTNILMTASSVATLDFDKDGHTDLLLGGRATPQAYGRVPKSYLLRNDGTGRFVDVTQQIAPELSEIGFVKNAECIDIDQDKDLDVVLAMEWEGVTVLENQGGKFTKKVISDKGWWNFTLSFDADGDGDLDILAGNLGQNSRLQASPTEPVRMYVNDFDKNGTVEQIMSYYLAGKELIFANKLEVQKQLPATKKKFLLAKEFAQASIADIVGSSELDEATVLEANLFDNTLLINDGKGNFSPQALPQQAQWSSFYTAQLIDANNDKLPDVLLMGNFYDCNIQMGRYDADYGTVLINQGKGRFEAKQIKNLAIKGQVKRSKSITINGQKAIAVARNNDKMMVLKTLK